MKIVLATLNSKFTHSSLALRDIQAYLKKMGIDTELVEYTINSNVFSLIGELYRKRPEVLCLSTYIWNVAEILYLAQQIKKVLPKCHIIFGGPEVSYNAVAYLEQHDFIDAVIQGEGEWSLHAYLSKLNDQQRSNTDSAPIPGVAFRAVEGIVWTPQLKKLPDLDEVPFAYENFDGLENRILYYESSRGCPFSCSYCLSSATEGVRFLSDARWQSDLKKFISANVMQVKFIDRTFNANPNRALQMWQFIKEMDNGMTNFHFEITASLLRDEDISFLRTLRPGLIQFEIGVQTTLLESSIAVNRRLPFDSLKNSVQTLLLDNNINIHLDLIAGLPYETFERFLKSLDDVFSLKPHMLQLGFLKLIKGSKIRSQIDEFGYVYDELPPYEILSNNFIAFEELLLLKDIEEVLEHYYNSKHFVNSLKLVLTAFESPSVFFLEYSKWLRLTGAFDMPHKTEKWAEWLMAFADHKGLQLPYLRDILIYDWMLALGKLPPDCLAYHEDVKTDVFEWVKTDTFLANHPQFLNITPKEAVKKIRFTRLKYNIRPFVYNEYEVEDIKRLDLIMVVFLDERHPVTSTYSSVLF